MESKPSWENERSLSDRQNGRPVGLFRLGPEGQRKAYSVRILPIGAADEWCRVAREIVDEGDLIPDKMKILRKRSVLAWTRRGAEVDKLPESEDKIEALEEMERGQIEDEREIVRTLRDLQRDYTRKMVDHVFEYDPEALPKDEIMALNPDYPMLLSAFMRLVRFTDPTGALAAVVRELTAT